MNDERTLIAFNAICSFINDICDEYGKKHRPLKLYKRLINQTQISHTEAIKKHINRFREFCLVNRDGIMEQDESKFTSHKISYSERVFVDISKIFRFADNDTKPVIWQHILTISALLDPAGKAKEILRKNAEEGKSSQKETEFLHDIISKVESNTSPDANPMEAISSLLGSGIMTDMMSAMQGGGDLDIGKLLGAVQGMVGSLQQQAGDDPQAKQVMGMMTSMLGSVQQGEQPDMTQVMSTMMTTMSGGTPPSSVVEEVSDDKKED